MSSVGAPGCITLSRAEGPLSETSIKQHLTGLRKWLRNEGGYNGTMSTFMVRLLKTKAEWADQVFIGLLKGRYGAELQDEALYTVHRGFGTDTIVKSLASLCVKSGRLKLLSDVADLGMPDSLRRDNAGAAHVMATTETGKWADILSSTNETMLAAEGRFYSLPRRMQAMGEVSPLDAPALQVMADIVVKHDPGHRDIALLEGRAKALFTEALMRERLQQERGLEASANPTPAPHRLSRAV